MKKRQLFIRDGVIVDDATPEEREAARRTPFPGVGRRLDGGPVVPPPLVPYQNPLPDGDLTQQVTSHDDGQPPDDGGGGAILRELAPSIRFLPLQCGWSSLEISCLRLVLLLDLEALVQRMQTRARRRLQFLNLLSLNSHIPHAMPRPVFRPDRNFLDSDVGSRAIVELLECFDLSSGIAVLRDTLQSVSTYRHHPLAINLTANLVSMMSEHRPVQLVFPQDSGEVMYVINRDYEIIIAARSGHQRDLPHPTLIGGDDPEVLSAGLVFFRDGRIVCVFINASGHFKPNDLSSIEVSMAVFSKLPTDAFHPEFLGYQIFQHGGHRMIHGPIPLGGGSLYQPFAISPGPDLRGTLEATSALARKQQMADVFAMLRNVGKKVVNGMLMAAIVNGQSTHPLMGLMTGDMKRIFLNLQRTISLVPNLQGARQRALGQNALFQTLVNQLLLRLQALLEQG